MPGGLGGAARSPQLSFCQQIRFTTSEPLAFALRRAADQAATQGFALAASSPDNLPTIIASATFPEP